MVGIWLSNPKHRKLIAEVNKLLAEKKYKTKKSRRLNGESLPVSLLPIELDGRSDAYFMGQSPNSSRVIHRKILILKS